MFAEHIQEFLSSFTIVLGGSANNNNNPFIC